MEYANIHPIIGNLCIKPEGGIDVEMFKSLHTDLSIYDALDFLEMQEVSNSWHKAMRANDEYWREIGKRKK